MKDRKAWNDLVQKDKIPFKGALDDDDDDDDDSRLLNYALSYLLNTFKQKSVY